MIQRLPHSVQPPRQLHGFTLLEVVVVVAILAILAAVVVPQFLDRPGEARQVRAKQDIAAVITALNLYKLDNFRYPSTDQGLDALVKKPSGTPPAENWRAGGYLPRLPMDPWGQPYRFLNPGQHGDIDVYSLGADARQGGEGEDADLGNWMP